MIEQDRQEQEQVERTERTRGEGLAKRKGRRRVVALVVLVALVLGVSWTATRSPLVRVFVLGQIESAFGVEARAERVWLTLDGRVLAEGVRVELPGVDGPAGRFLEVDDAEVVVAFDKLFGPGVPVGELTLDGVHARLSIDEEYRLNTDGIRMSEPGGGLPAIRLRDVVVEIGEHRGDEYEELERLGVRISLTPVGEDEYRIALEQQPIGDEELIERLVVTGTTNSRTRATTLDMSGLDFADWSRRDAPREVRELWRAMDVRGRVDAVRFSYEPNEGVSARIAVEGVDLNLPLTVNELGREARGLEGSGSSEADAAAGDELLQMRRVRGEMVFGAEGVEAELEGMVEEVPARVEMELRDFSLDAPLRLSIATERFEIRGGRGVLGFAPEMALEIYDRFTGPTGMLEMRVELERAERGGDLDAVGVIEVSGGEARFEFFPYPLEDLSGVVRFDSERVSIEDFRARGPTGAELEASGFIAPPGDGAEVRIDVSARGLPTDAVFVNALPEMRREVFNAVFNEAEYERLLGAGLIRRPGAGAEDGGRPDAAPAFELGGVAQMDIRVRRALGMDSDYKTYVEMRLPEAGLLIDRFPYPVVARELALEISPGEVLVNGPELRGLSGGRGSVFGRIDYEEGEDGYEPAIEVVASEIPVDGYLLQALPEDGESADAGRGGAGGGAGVAAEDADDLFADVSIRRMLDALNIEGVVEARAEVLGARGAAERGLTTVEGGELSYDISVSFAGVAAQPGDGTTRAERVAGELRVTPSELRVDELRGRIGAASWSADVTALLSESDGGPEAERVRASLEVRGLDLSRSVEAYLAAVAPERAAAIEELRLLYRPRGVIDARVTLDSAMPADEAWRIEVERAATIGFEQWGGLVEFDQPTIGIVVTPREARVDRFSGDAMFRKAPTESASPAGRIAVSGSLPIGDGGEGEVGIGVSSLRFASPMTLAVVESETADAAEWLRDRRLDGLFDAEVVRRWSSGVNGPIETDVRLFPKTLALDSRGRRIELGEVNGWVDVGERGGAIEVEGSGGEFGGSFAGRWFTPVFPGAGVGLEGELSGWMEGLAEPVLALLPAAVETAASGIALELPGRVKFEGAQLTLARPLDDEIALERVDTVFSGFEGEVLFERAALELGSVLTIESGAAMTRTSVPVASRTGERLGTGEWSIELVADRAETLQGVPLTSAVALVRNGSTPGSAIVPQATADCLGGRVSVIASVRPPASGERTWPGADPRASRFRIAATAADVAFGELLNVWLDESSEAGGGLKRGLFTADLTLEGVVGVAESRLGRATMRVRSAGRGGGSGGPTEVLRLPGVVELVKLTSLRAPASAPIEFAYADAFVRGRTLHLRDVSLETNQGDEQRVAATLQQDAARNGDKVAIVGAGTVTWPDFDLDLRFTASLVQRRSLVAEILDALRNEVVTARVRGTLLKPEISFEQFPATRRLVESIISGEPIRAEPTPLSSPRAR